jgi:hypothetical protein
MFGSLAWLGSILVAITWFKRAYITRIKNPFLINPDNLEKLPFTVTVLR